MTLGLQSKADYQFNVPANVVIEKNRYIIIPNGLSADGYLLQIDSTIGCKSSSRTGRMLPNGPSL